MSGRGGKTLLSRQLARSALLAAVRPGKQAVLAGDRPRFVEESGKFRESLDFDRATKKAYPQKPRWDYVVDVEREGAAQVEAAEVHPATAGEVDIVLAKKAWSAPALTREGVTVSAWHWITTDSGVGFRRGGREEKRLTAAGIAFPKRRLVA